MGSVYAALLADAGNEVHVVDIWQDHIDTINRDGLRVSGASGERVVTTLNAHSSTGSIGICDLVIIVNLDRYPVDRIDHGEGLAFARECKQRYDETGLCILPGFVSDSAVFTKKSLLDFS